MNFCKPFTGTASLLESKSLNKSQTILTRLRNVDKAAILNMTAEIMDSKFYSSNYSNRINQLNLN